MYIFMHIVSCHNVHYSISKNTHLHKKYYISGRWRKWKGEAAPTIERLLLEERF